MFRMSCIFYMYILGPSFQPETHRDTEWHKHDTESEPDALECECDASAGLLYSFLTVSTDRISNIHSEVLALVCLHRLDELTVSTGKDKGDGVLFDVRVSTALLPCWLTCTTKPSTEVWVVNSRSRGLLPGWNQGNRRDTIPGDIGKDISMSTLLIHDNKKNWHIRTPYRDIFEIMLTRFCGWLYALSLIQTQTAI
jgi:hypothetical protein